MKKTTLIFIVSISLSTISCEKKYTCECSNAWQVTGVYTLSEKSSSSAQTTCKSHEYHGDVCTIK